MRALTRKSIKDVTRRKLRTALTVLGIAVGVMGLSAISVASAQVNASFQFSAHAANQPDIQLLTSPADPALAADLAAVPNVRRVETGSVEAARWAIPSGHYPFVLGGVSDFQHARLTQIEIVAGNLPGPGQILLESSDRAVQQERVGDTITLVVRGQPQQLVVSGFGRTSGQPSASFLGRASGYMRQTDLEALVQTSGVNSFLVQVTDYGQRDATAQALTQVLAAHQVFVLGATVGHTDFGLSQITNGLLAVLQVVAVVALLLSVFLLLSTIMALVAEQVPVIGTMKAIGARRGQVMRSYLTSVALYGIVGTVVGLGLGILLGILLANYLSDLFTLDTSPLSVSPWLIVTSVLVGIGVPILAAALPIYFGTRVTVHEALSGFGLQGQGGAATHPIWLGRLFSFLPQTAQLGLRSLFRRRTRAALTLLALALSGACFLAVQTTSHSFGAFLDQTLQVYDADVFVFMPNPAPDMALQQVLGGVPGIARTERLAQDDVQSRWGGGLLTGVQPDAQLYQRHMVAGRWFQPGDSNVVVLSDKAAAASGLGIGGTISFHDDLHSATWRVIGIARDGNDASLKLGVLLAPIDQVSAFRGLPPGYSDGLLVRSTSASLADVNALSAHLDDALSRAGYPASVSTRQQIVQRNDTQFLVLVVLLYAVSAIVALVGAIGLFNALAMSVLERRREIGILRSMGARGGKVAQVFWTEGLALGILGWFLAILLGIPAAYGFVQLLSHLIATLPFAFDPVSLVWMLAFILVVATVASIGPAWAARRVRIAQTLRYE
jgi:putative ABC transport system permease protein